MDILQFILQNFEAKKSTQSLLMNRRIFSKVLLLFPRALAISSDWRALITIATFQIFSTFYNYKNCKMQLFNKINKKLKSHNLYFFNRNTIFCNFTAKLYQLFNIKIAIIYKFYK